MSAALSVRNGSHPELNESAARNRANLGPAPALLVLALERVSRRFARSPTSCSDLQQETLIALWLSTEAKEPRVSLQTWLCTVADSLANVADDLGSTAQHASQCTSAEADCTLSLQPVTGLLLLLETFRPAEREVLLLDLQQFSLRQIAEALRCSPERARSLIVDTQRGLALWTSRFAQRSAAE